MHQENNPKTLVKKIERKILVNLVKPLHFKIHSKMNNVCQETYSSSSQVHFIGLEDLVIASEDIHLVLRQKFGNFIFKRFLRPIDVIKIKGKRKFLSRQFPHQNICHGPKIR